jgi:DeoR family glycerol-3-phosphate regulon repressor
MVAGGALRRSDGGLVGELATQFIEQFKVDYAIIGTSALDLDGDMLDYDLAEVRVRPRGFCLPMLSADGAGYRSR